MSNSPTQVPPGKSLFFAFFLDFLLSFFFLLSFSLSVVSFTSPWMRGETHNQWLCFSEMLQRLGIAVSRSVLGSYDGTKQSDTKRLHF